jgi:hypothetical protein
VRIRNGSAAAIVVLLCILQSPGLSQIPNAGFEDWTNGSPDGWATSNVSQVLTPVRQSSNAHTGTSAVYGEVSSLPPIVIQPIIQTGPVGQGFPYNGRPAAFTGYYQFSSIEGDRLAINVGLFIGGVENGTPVGLAAEPLTSTVTGYTQFTVPFVYLNPGVPDTCVIQVQIVGPNGGDFHVGSSFLLDDLAMSGTTDVVQGSGTIPITPSLEQNYPNPFNPSTTIRYELPRASHVTLTVYDLLGREVATLIDDVEEPGYKSVEWNAASVASGVYLYRLKAGSFVQTRKMTILK